MRPEKVYLLESEFVMEWPGYKEKFFLREFADDGSGYSYSADVGNFDIGDYGSPDEMRFKMEVLGYSPCFKGFSRCGYGKDSYSLPYETVDMLMEEKGTEDGQ